MPHRRLICAAHRCGKTGRLIRAARRAQTAGVPVWSMLALTVHAPAAAGLRDALCADLGADVPVATVRRRALSLLAGDPEAAALPPDWQAHAVLSGIDRRLLIRQAWAAAGVGPASLWHARGDQPGALDWVAGLFDQFSAWAGSADPDWVPELRPADPGLAELWRAYRGYLRLCHAHGVVGFAEIFNRARDALRRRPLQPPRLLLLDDLDLFDPAELLFVSALIGPETDVIATAVAPPDARGALAAERFLADWLARHAFVIDDACVTPLAPPQLSLGEYPTPEDEAEAIIAALAALDDPAACAVVPFDAELLPLLRRSAARAGVPLAGMVQRDGATLALAPLALAGLKLIAAQPLTAQELQALLSHPALGLPPADAHLLAEEARLTRATPFDPAVALPSGLSEAARTCLVQMRQATGAMREAALPPSARLTSWLEATGLAERAWLQTEAALSDEIARIDRRLWERLIGFLEQTERLRRRLDLPFGPADAVEVFGAAQALIEPESPPMPGAARLWSPDELGGRVARHVFVAGLHEGALPATPVALPVIDETALAAAFGRLPGFVPPQLDDRAAAWVRGQRSLQRAVGRARDRVHLSYSRTSREGARRLPSPILAAYLGLTPDRHGSLVAAAGQAGIACDTAAPVPRRASRPRRLPETLPPAAATTPASPFEVTPSEIEDWFACPRRCFYARRLRLYDVVSSPRQALGQIVHTALHRLLCESDGAPLDDRRALALLDRCWNDDLRFWGTPLKARVFRRLAEQAVLNLARFERERSDGATFVTGELALRWPLPGSDVVMRARLDRIDQDAHGLHIIDYKLGSQSPSLRALLEEWLPPAEEAAAAAWRPGDIQLPLYALALEQGAASELDLPQSRVRSVTLIYPLFLYNEAGRRSETGVRRVEIVDHGDDCPACAARTGAAARSRLICRHQLSAVADWARRAVAAMRADIWHPDPREGQQTCARCAFRAICPDPR